MFGGLVTTTGRVAEAPTSSAPRISVTHPEAWTEIQVGDSVAVNGCCLTAVRVQPGGFVAEVMPETLRRTNLGRLGAGSRVNLEAPLELGGRVGGHLVQGHIDATGAVARLEPEGNACWVSIRMPAELARYCVPQGSLAVDGCSLTIAELNGPAQEEWEARFSLIPHTLAQTIASGYRMGTVVNLEADLMAKLVERLAAPYLEPLARKVDR